MIHKLCSLSLFLLATAVVSLSQTRSVLIPVTPCRVVDTRQTTGPLGAPDMLAGTTRSFPVPTSACGIPATASAYSLNVTVVPAGALQYLSIWPTGQTQPVVSTLNDNGGQIIANAAIVPAGTSGAVSVFVTDETNVIIDIDGYFTRDQTDSTSQSTAYGAGALANDISLGGQNSAFGTNTLTANTSGSSNTASGTQALFSNTSGSDNTASGFNALFSNISGTANTATGESALYGNTTGSNNTAYGYAALYANKTGTQNAASGASALSSNLNGSQNEASGFQALTSNTSGSYNTASGGYALRSNTTGSYNTASGNQALYYNTGSYNVASGSAALLFNNAGTGNTGSGVAALYTNSNGDNNSAFGDEALYLTTGSSNTALGTYAGYSITTGSNNVDIANSGLSNDSGIIRIGTGGTQTSTYISGISGVTVTGSAVIVNSSGQLGVASSSIKYKEDVQDLGNDMDNALMQLRPVSFRYKGTAAVQYGLIAEEVDQVIPSLVSRDSHGDPMSVQYHELPALLLGEMQRQRTMIDKLEKRLAELESRPLNK